jgi:hypothetical protein
MCHFGTNWQKVIGYKDYYFESEQVLCMQAFSTSAVATTIDNGAFPPGSTECNDDTGHNCKMPKALYKAFCHHVLGLPPNSWTSHQTEMAFCNLIIQDLDAMMFYYDTDCYNINQVPFSYLGDQKDMARILARLTLLLVGADACTTHIINSVWGEDNDAWLTLGGPQGDLSLIRQKKLSLLKVAINAVYIWTTNPDTPILQPTSDSFKRLPPTLQNLILGTHQHIVFAREPVPPGTAATQLLTTNLCNHTVPNNLSFKEKAIRWYHDLLLHHNVAGDMTGFDNRILIAYGMCPPCKTMEYYQLDPCITPSGFMQGTAPEVWGDDTHEVMQGTSSSWKDTDV